MPDLDELMTPRVSRAAADAARVPAVGALAARGARRRRRRRGVVLVGAAAAVAAVTLGLGQLGNGGAISPTPGPQPSTRSTSTTPTAHQESRDLAASRQILAASDSRVWSLTVAPGSTRNRLSQWYTCHDSGTCDSRSYALEVTDDGFRSAKVVDLPPSDDPYQVEPAGAERFIVSRNGRLVGLVDLAGRVHGITVTGRPAPAASGEVVSTLGTKRAVAVDSRRGSAHPLAVPLGTRGVTVLSGRLWADARTGYSWSDDGGAHWTPVSLPAGSATGVTFPIPSSDPGKLGIIIGGTQINSSIAWRGTLLGVDGSTPTSYPPAASAIGAEASAILPDGRLLVLVTTWHSWQSGRHSPRAGFYAGQDPSHLSPVSMGSPFDHLDYTAVPTILGVATEPGTVTIYAEAPGGSGVVASTDAGATWHEEAAR